MKIVEYLPKSELVEKYVYKYQLFEVEGPLLVKTVPTGSLECYVILDGNFEQFDPEQGRFETSKKSGFFPIGNSINSFFLRDYIKCFVIKIKPMVLGLPNFHRFIENWKNFPVESFLGPNGQEKIRSIDFTKTDTISDQVDVLLTNNNDFTSLAPKIEALMMSVFSENGTHLKVSELAARNNISVKSLERLTKEYFDMSPKKLLNIIRFGMSTNKLKKTEGFKLIDTLKYGYYDQSHFIRECKRITQLSPKELLSKLNLGVHDLIVDD